MMYSYCINFHRYGSLLFLICIDNDLLQRDLGIKPIISHFVEITEIWVFLPFNYCTYVISVLLSF